MKALISFGISFIAGVLILFAIQKIDNQHKEVVPLVLESKALSDEQWEFLKDYAKLIEYADELGYKLTAGELYRTMYQQRYYVRNGFSKTYNSKHLKRKAGDLNLFIDGSLRYDCEAYRPLGEFWESLSPKNRWGGSFNSWKDCPHFERR